MKASSKDRNIFCLPWDCVKLDNIESKAGGTEAKSGMVDRQTQCKGLTHARLEMEKKAGIASLHGNVRSPE